MILQPKTFSRFPSLEQMEKTLKTITSQKANITSYMWYLLPLSEKLGERVFDVAAKSLAESGVVVSPEELKALARDMRLPKKQEYYKKMRLKHTSSLITSVKLPKD